MSYRVQRHGVVDSTNERAFAALAEGSARNGDVHVAEEQTSGRGRRGARWVSVEGGLYASLILLPKPQQAVRPPALTMAAGLAALDAVRALGLTAGARLKWPNDLLCRDAKLCGILVEARGLDPEDPHFVIGMGINVAQRDFPPELLAERAVTSLALEGIEVGRDRALEALLDALAPRIEAALERPRELAAAYIEATGLLGRPVRVERGRDALHGRLVELDLDLGLTLEGPDGGRRRVALEHVTAVTDATSASSGTSEDPR